jgi:tetratricopeptide (TPR) repeat protein
LLVRAGGVDDAAAAGGVEELVRRRVLHGVDDAAAAGGVEELVRRRVLHGVDDGFGFVHERVREVAYERLLPLRRMRLHRTVAEAMEAQYADDLVPHHSVIGYHYRLAEAWEQAMRHLRDAGLAAYRRGGSREASAAFTQALAAHAHLPHTDEWKRQAIDLRFDLRHALIPTVDLKDLGRILQECERYATELNDRALLARTWAYSAHYHWWFAEHDHAIDLCRKALAVASETGDQALQISTNVYLGLAFYTLGAYRAAARVFRAIIGIGPQAGGVTKERFGLAITGIFTRSYLAMTLAELGDFSEAAAAGEEAIAAAEPLRHPFATAHAFIGAISVHLRQGDYDRAIRLFDWYQHHRAGLGSEDVWPLADWYAGFAYVQAGRLDEGIALLEQIREPAYSVTGGVGRSLLGAWLAEAYLLSGRVSDALPLAESAVRLAHEHKERGYEAWALRVLAEVGAAAAEPDVAAVEQRYLEARAIADELGMRPLSARCTLGLGLLSKKTQRRVPAHRELTAAAEAFRALAMKTYVDRAEAGLAGL